MRSAGRLSPEARLRATKPCSHRNTSVPCSSDDGAATTAGAVQRQRCNLKAVGSAPDGAGLRPPERGVPGQCRRAEWLHSARHIRHRSCGTDPSDEWGTGPVNRFTQQRRAKSGTVVGLIALALPFLCSVLFKGSFLSPKVGAIIYCAGCKEENDEHGDH